MWRTCRVLEVELHFFEWGIAGEPPPRPPPPPPLPPGSVLRGVCVIGDFRLFGEEAPGIEYRNTKKKRRGRRRRRRERGKERRERKRRKERS